ncbi:MAG: aminopeptidase [Bacilli bacterium]|nr:aminopeptidase [Bacilli bacterium]
MIKDFELLKRNYAKLIVRRGLNLFKGRTVRIFAELDQPQFVNMVAEECYLAGAKRVHVHWNYGPIERLACERISLKELKTLRPHKKEEIKFDIKNNVNYIFITSEDPYYLKGVDPQRIGLEQLTRRAYFFKAIGGKDRPPFSSVCVPGVKWAKTLFPKLSDEAAVEKLWQLIFKASHVNKKDPFANWDKHIDEIDRHAKWLNNLKIKTLHYTSKNGTDFVVGLLDHYHFRGASHFDFKTRRRYHPNMPSEECFTSPHRLKANGVLCSSKPFAFNGVVIKDARFVFKKGRIIEVSAKQNEKFLKQLINKSDAMHYLGELALVPYSSPINQMGILFLNILYDENACCHFAIGEGFPYAHRGYRFLSRKKLQEKGINFADNHIDFMVGTSDLNIVATTKDGKKVNIFKNGEWAK